jgi:hypothetical protein
MKHIKSYFVDGKLPPADTVCADVPSPFDQPPRMLQRDGQVPFVLTDEDQELLGAIESLSVMHRHPLPL